MYQYLAVIDTEIVHFLPKYPFFHQHQFSTKKVHDMIPTAPAAGTINDKIATF